MVSTADALGQVGQYVQQVEQQLARLLAGGWSAARGDVAQLTSQADTCAALGLEELARRLRAVAAAETATEALPAIAAALTACQLLLARLPLDAPPAGAWTPLEPGLGADSGSATLVPLARVILADREVWACQGTFVGEATPRLVLLDAPPVEETTDELRTEATAPWLRLELRGRAVWQANHPLGSGDPCGWVPRYTLEAPPPSTFRSKQKRSQTKPLAAYVDEEQVSDGQRIGRTDWLRLRELTLPVDARSQWLDPASAAHLPDAVARVQELTSVPTVPSAPTGRLRALVRLWAGPAEKTPATAPTDRVWALVQETGGGLLPLALVIPRAGVQAARLVHLVPGCPVDTLD